MCLFKIKTRKFPKPPEYYMLFLPLSLKTDLCFLMSVVDMALSLGLTLPDIL